jgi:DNA-binding CsgD family transcriptional regulator
MAETKKKSRYKKKGPNKKKAGRPSLKVRDHKELTLKEKIFAEKVRNMTMKNTEIAEKLGCHEATVRKHLRESLKGRIEEYFHDKFRDEIFFLQNKAFRRLAGLLDDPKTPPATLANICRFLLEKFITGDLKSEEGETIEFETVISESGQMSQIKRKVIEKSKKISKDSPAGTDYGKWAQEMDCIDVTPNDTGED